MWPFGVVVGHILADGPAKVPFAEWHDAIEAFRLDRSDEALSVGVRVRCPVRGLDDLEPRVFEVAPHRLTPLRIPVTDQDPVVGEGPIVGKYSVCAICCMNRALG